MNEPPETPHRSVTVAFRSSAAAALGDGLHLCLLPRGIDRDRHRARPRCPVHNQPREASAPRRSATIVVQDAFAPRVGTRR